MNTVIEYLLQALFAFIATVGFCILFKIPTKQYPVCGLNGVLSWIIYYALSGPMGIFIATFFATSAIALTSRILAVIRKTPATILLIPGIIPLVPGSYIYHTAYNFFMGNGELFSKYGFGTVKLAFSIVLGIVIVFALPIKKYSFSVTKK